MTRVQVAVPVLHGRRRFHFDKARPWSVLEHMLLYDIGNRPTTAATLAERAHLPQRIIIEALIRLMHVNWVEMVPQPSGIHFQVTAEGQVYREYEHLPTSPRRLSRNMNFVVDQITGSVFRSRDFPFLHEHVVEERARSERIVWIERPSAKLHEGISPLVEALFQDDERFIAIDPYGDKLAERWSLVSVRNGQTDSLTQRAPAVLIDAILAAAKFAELAGENSNGALYSAAVQSTTRQSPDVPDRSIAFNANDLIVGGKEHGEALLNALRKARHRIIIHSTFIAESRFNELLPELRKALAQGVTIDILWGQNRETDPRKSTSRVVMKLRTEIEKAGLDNLRIYPFSTASHAKILVADEGKEDKLTAIIGSCNWLYSGFTSFEVSARVRDPIVVADILHQLAELSRGSSGHWTDLTVELTSLAEKFRTMQHAPGKATASVIIGDRHAQLIRKARDRAQRQIVVASHKFGGSAENAVLAPLLTAKKDTPDLEVKLYYGESSGRVSGIDVADLTRNAAKMGAQVSPVHHPTLHAKFLTWDDDDVVITSQNWLSADPADDNQRQEIGLLLHSPGLARLLLQRFNASIM